MVPRSSLARGGELPCGVGDMRVWQCCIDSAYFRGMGMKGFQLRSPAAIRRRGRASHPGPSIQPILLHCLSFALDRYHCHTSRGMQGQEGQVQRSNSTEKGCSTQFVRNSSFAECASHFSGALLKNEFRRAQAQPSTDFQFQPGHPATMPSPNLNPSQPRQLCADGTLIFTSH